MLEFFFLCLGKHETSQIYIFRFYNFTYVNARLSAPGAYLKIQLLGGGGAYSRGALKREGRL